MVYETTVMLSKIKSSSILRIKSVHNDDAHFNYERGP
jgi:hypothetical protein